MTATHRAGAAGVRRPGTPAGRYLRSTATNERADGPPGPDAADVFARAFAAVARLRFRVDTPLPAISASVAAAARRHPAPSLPVREAEMLIRQALGEYVPTAGITGAQGTAVHLLIFAALVDEMALTDDEIDELIAGAEAADAADMAKPARRGPESVSGEPAAAPS